MLEKDQVQHIANLARLELTPEEIKKFQKELSLILDYMETLKKADVSDQKIGLSQTLKELPEIDSEIQIRREDEAVFSDAREELLELMPQREGDYLKTKPIIKK